MAGKKKKAKPCTPLKRNPHRIVIPRAPQASSLGDVLRGAMEWDFAGYELANGSPRVYAIMVSPNVAEALLGFEFKQNRKSDTYRIDRIASAMRNGRYIPFNGKNQIVFMKEDGRFVLVDGGHRLRAVIRSGMTVGMLIYGPVPPEWAESMDIDQKARTVKNLAKMRGETHTSDEVFVAGRVAIGLANGHGGTINWQHNTNSIETTELNRVAQRIGDERAVYSSYIRDLFQAPPPAAMRRHMHGLFYYCDNGASAHGGPSSSYELFEYLSQYGRITARLAAMASARPPKTGRHPQSHFVSAISTVIGNYKRVRNKTGNPVLAIAKTRGWGQGDASRG